MEYPGIVGCKEQKDGSHWELTETILWKLTTDAHTTNDEHKVTTYRHKCQPWSHTELQTWVDDNKYWRKLTKNNFFTLTDFHCMQWVFVFNQYQWTATCISTLVCNYCFCNSSLQLNPQYPSCHQTIQYFSKLNCECFQHSILILWSITVTLTKWT